MQKRGIGRGCWYYTFHTIDGTAQTVHATINGADDAPNGAADKIIVSNQTQVTLPFSVFLANDADPQNLPLTMNGVSNAGAGISNLTYSSPNQTISFTTAPSASGTSSFTYSVSNGSSASNVTVNVQFLTTANANSNDTWDLSGFTPHQASYLDGQNGNDAISGSTISAQLGGSQIDFLFGSQGNDTLSGGAGNDVLTGGNGADTFVFGKGFGNDLITDFGHSGSNLDVLHLDLPAASLNFTQSGNDLVITSKPGVAVAWDADDSLTLKNVSLASFDKNWIV